jgi:hypothetical protein
MRADTWMFPPEGGWTYDQINDLDLPFEWELMAGKVMPRGRTKMWHDCVRDEVYMRLRSVQRAPLAVDLIRSVMVSPETVIRSDVVVQDRRGVDIFTDDCTAVETVKLVVEVVCRGSRMEDRYLKPGLLGEARVPYYWRVERGKDDLPEVHEFRWDSEADAYAPAPDRAIHKGRLRTDVPFPIEIDLASLVEL